MGRAIGLVRRGERVCGVQLEDETLSADAVVIAMGPWSALASEWLPLPPVYGLKGHSLVFETGIASAGRGIVSRLCRSGRRHALARGLPACGWHDLCLRRVQRGARPGRPGPRRTRPGALDRLTALCARVSPVLANSPIVASGACYRPVTGDGLPLIGAIGDVDRVFVATGHSVWGILNAPATGEAMAELVLDGTARTVDLSPFDPARFGGLGRGRVAIARRVGR